MNWKKLFHLLLVLIICATFLKPLSTLASGQFISGSYGGKTYKLYIPSHYDSNLKYPLYVMLHGCYQDAKQFSTGTKMNTLAEEKGFLVLYPEQSFYANMNKCWKWFDYAHQKRGSGEPSVIAGMVNSIKNQYSINENKVYVAGLSAGAAMSVIMAATYPDIFSGAGVGAGVEYQATNRALYSLMVMYYGGPDPAEQGRIAYREMGKFSKKMPVIVFHGTADYTVKLVNGNQVITQWAKTNDLSANNIEDDWIDDQAENTEMLQVPNGRRYTISDYEGRDGKVLMKKVVVEGMGHAWSGGSIRGSFTDPRGPDASRMMWEFFSSYDSE